MKVLLAIDSSKSSQAVLNNAVARPWPPQTTFCVLSIVDLSHWDGLPELIEDARSSAQTLVKAAADKLTNSGHKTIAAVQLGFPRNAITKYAKQWGADLIMVGSRGLNAVTRVLLGSVAQAILRSAPCSVEIVRASSRDLLAFSEAMKVLVATDGSKFSATAVDLVAKHVWPVGTQFKIVSVAELIIPENLGVAYTSTMPYPTGLLEELLNRARSHAQEAVANARQKLGAANLNVVDPGAISFGDPQTVLLDKAKMWGADLIILGSHGRHGIDRMLMGSVSEAVALHAHCSVEVMHPRDPAARMEDAAEQYASGISA